MKSKMTFLNETEKIKAEIKMLQKKLDFLEELSQTKSPVEEAYKKVYGVYPTNEITYNSMWGVFQKGYYAAQEDYKVGKYKEPEKSKINDLAEKFLPDDHPYKIADEHGELNPYKQGLNMVKKDKETEELMTSKGYEKNSAGFWEPKPQTPEQVSDGLKEAFREAVKQGIIPEVDKVSEVFMNEMVAELKGQTLTDIIWNWWGNVFTSNEEWDAENCIEHLVDLIEAFLPKPQSAEGSQNAYVESAVEGFNDAIKQIKSKLR